MGHVPYRTPKGRRWRADDFSRAASAGSKGGRLELLKVLLSMDDGSHLQKVPQLEYYKVKALRFAPKWEGGLLGVDGERVPFTPIDIRVCDGAISVAAKPVATGQIVGLGAEGAGVSHWASSLAAAGGCAVAVAALAYLYLHQ